MKKKRILVLGANGMLGGSIHRYLSSSKEFDVLGTVRSVAAKYQLNSLGFNNVRFDVDVLDEAVIGEVIKEFQPNFVINCVGLIKQLSESKDYEQSIRINSLLPHTLARLCNIVNAKLVHFSTDCVFTGSKGNYTETDVPDERDIYGRSKLLGEVDYKPHLTLRTSIIGHELNTNVSLIDWFLSQQGCIKGFSKAIFSGLPTVVVAEILKKIIIDKPTVTGLYHLSAKPISKYDLLRMVANEYNFDIMVEDYDAYTVDKSLNCRKLKENFTGLKIEDWSALIKKMHGEYLQFFSAQQ